MPRVDAVVSRINATIESEAKERGLACVPLNAVLRERLARAKCPSPLAYDATRSVRLAISSILRHYLLRWSWDEIAEHNGMLMLTDMIHLGGRGGRLLVELVEREIRNTTPPDV